MADEMANSNEAPRKWSRRKVLSAAGAGLATGLVGSLMGGVIPFGREKTPKVAAASSSPSLKPAVSPSLAPTATLTKAPTPKPPEILTGELPDILSSKDDYEKYFAQEEDSEKINEMIKQQQIEENNKAKVEGRNPRIVALFRFNPVKTAESGTWEVRKLKEGLGAETYSILVPKNTELSVPFEGGVTQSGFSNGGNSVDVKSKLGFEFWTMYFGDVDYNQSGSVIAGEKNLVASNIKTFTKWGLVDMKGETSFFLAIKDSSNISGSSLPIKWLTNPNNQVLYH